MDEKIINIISKSLGGQLNSNEEEQELKSWLLDKRNKSFYDELKSFTVNSKEALKQPQANVDTAFQLHLDKMKKKHLGRRVNLIKRMLPYAASVLLMIGVFFVAMHLEDSRSLQEEQWLLAIKPGSQKAELVLADGKVLSLDDNQKRDEITEKDGTVINHTNSGLVYDASTKKNEMINYNSLFVPRGGEYQLKLEDGTKIWVNSETRLRYPTKFEKKQRIVLLEGEAYFDVSEDKNRPFIVKTQGVEIHVLGTEFNVSSYAEEENIRTTLVEGSVSVKDHGDNKKTLLLNPGYQAVYNKEAKNLESKKVNVDLYTSWKDGKFVFQKSSLSDIMNRVSRWYDVKVFYQNTEVADINFTGTLKRYEKLDRLLGMIEKTNEVNFVLKNNTIVVQKNYTK
jgi:ferric-dicitrate binding protein FerR (iron transport regulator)